MKAAFVSFRFSGTDGVSIETTKWRQVFEELGFDTFSVAGEGPCDRRVPGLAIGATDPPAPGEIEAAVDEADVVVVENLCSLPLNPGAAHVVASVLRRRPAILHHHDLPWQRPQFRHLQGFPPDDPAWRHVTINLLSLRELSERGIAATAIPNSFDTEVPEGDRGRTRETMGIDASARLVLHPTRAIPRKNIPAAVALAEALGATYWLLGPAEDGYDDDLERVLEKASTPVVHGCPPDVTVAGAYAAADAIVLPSTWEGFGNATVESAIFRKPLAIGNYPVAREIAAFGFRWFPSDYATPLDGWLSAPDDVLLDTNRAIARRHFSLPALRRRLKALLSDAGWLPEP